jgi:hypothetical protein
VSPCTWAASRSRSRTTPGCTRASFRSASISRIRFRYFEQSTTTATFVVCPARPVPPPRGTIGAPCSRQRATVATTSSTERGITTPIGRCR